MEVESVIADAPGCCALVLYVGDLVGLAINARLHDVVLADGTVVNVDVPGPQRDRVPFLYLKSFLGRSVNHLRSRKQF